ncbi:GNAT family N-acetyltransferase [Alkalihalophilus pseudofirmus]|nr:GNAT family N-acetyltransferase [Alkalihalophilus pseudofirmus]
MIKKLDATNRKVACEIWKLQMASYNVEAKLIGYTDLPPLKETVENIQQCGEEFLGYLVNEKVVGAIAYKKLGEVIDIHRLMVHPSHFRKGIARTLLSSLETSEPSIRELIVSTGTSNLPAVHFYERNGFQETGKLEINDKLSITNLKKVRING